MARSFSPEEHRAGLTLVVKPLDDPDRPVDAEQFLQAATKWLASLTSFASDFGHDVRWEIAELKRSSAVLEVIPVDVQTGLIADAIATKWNKTVRQIEASGAPPDDLSPKTLNDLQHFTSTANDLSVSVLTGQENDWPHTITVETQRSLQKAVAALPAERYTVQGTLRGRLEVLNSWNPRERWFRLRLPLAPDKQVRCVYDSEALITELGDTFERLIDVTGTLHYRTAEAWPFLVEVATIRKLRNKSMEEVEANIRPIPLPDGLSSVESVRRLRDAE